MILRFRHLLEKRALATNMLHLLANEGLLLKSGKAGVSTLISAPNSTKNTQGKPNPQMLQTKNDHQRMVRKKPMAGAA